MKKPTGQIIKGFTRAGGMVVNTDQTPLELIKRDRARKREWDSMQKQLSGLRDMVLALKNEVEALKRG